jgi:hypothetical protein
MKDEEFSTLNELLYNGIAYPSVRHGKAKIGKSFFEWHLSPDYDRKIALVSYKNGGTWNDERYIDEVDQALIAHLAKQAMNNLPAHSYKDRGIGGPETESYTTREAGHFTTEVPKSDAFDAEVLQLFRDNRFVELVRKNVQKFHVGDWNVAELEMLSVASQSVVNTDGIQPKLSGESGKGKTHVSRTVLHLLDPSMYRAASFSSKVLFYDDTLKPKTVIFSDDVNLNEDAEEIVRAAMSNWYEPTQRMTLDSKRNAVTLSLPPRISFWFTSVKTTSTLQLINRQVEVNVDESPDQDKRVEEHQRRQSALGVPDFYVDDEVALLRQAFLHLNQIDFKVKIPFVDRIRFTKVSNRRNLPIFLDLIKAYCVLNNKAREADEEGALIATREDFENALKLFETVAVQQITKLNEKERQIAAVIKDLAPCDIREIKDEVGLSHNYVYELIHGKHNTGNKGLLEKIPELVLYPKNEFNPATGNRWGRNHYSLPEGWAVIDNCQSIVYWDERDKDQLRTVSHSFEDELRNSEEGGEGLDDGKDPLSVGIIDNASTNFATSERCNTVSSVASSSDASVSERNSERKLKDVLNSPTNGSEREMDALNNRRSVSEIPSEVERKTGEATHSAPTDGTNDTNLSHSNWHPRTVIPRHTNGKWVTFVKMKVLGSIPEFAGIDGTNYKLGKNETLHLPEANAKVLWRKKLAVLAPDEAQAGSLSNR